MLDYYMFNKLLRDGTIRVEHKVYSTDRVVTRYWSDEDGNVYCSYYNKNIKEYITDIIRINTSIEHLYKAIDSAPGRLSIITSIDKRSKRCVS